MSFNDLSLHPLVLKALDAGGYTMPTPIQSAAIPPALAGRDVLATADTGTGKTAAFLLPALTRLAQAAEAAGPGRREAAAPRILVLAPTRELARQVTDAVRKYGKFLNLHSFDLVGGMPYRDQLRMLSRPVDVVVGTPGRLLDHIERRRLNLGQVDTLVLDEADRMLDMGFLDDVRKIAGACPAGRQTMLFTATLDKRMSGLATQLLKTPERITAPRTEQAAIIEQRLHHADDVYHKRRLLMHFATAPDVAKAIVFAATKRDADQLAGELLDAGHAAAALHGDMDQHQRNRTLQQLRTGQVRLLVATDVASRGIDVKDISHVINFDMPRSGEDYVHRIGRTGRAGATGVAISFVGRADRDSLGKIERYTGARLAVHVIPGLEPRRPVARPGAPAPAAKRPHRGNGPATGRGRANGGTRRAAAG